MHEKPHFAWLTALVLAIAPIPASAAPAPDGAPAVHIEVLGGKDRGPVRLHARYVEIERSRFIERADVSTAPVCEAPCDRPVPEASEASFVVSGPRVARSRVFTIPPGRDVTVQVKPRPRGVRPLGLVLGPLGAAGMVAGAVTMIVANDDTRLLTIGGITLGASIPLVIVGAILARWGRTRVAVVSK